MAAALHTALSRFSVNDPLTLASSSYAYSIQSVPRTSHSALSFKHCTAISTANLLQNCCLFFPLAVNLPASTNLRRRRFCAVQEAAVLETESETETEAENQKRKLFVLNLSWALSVADIKQLFGQCGTVTDVEFIKRDNGKSKGYAFVTMASGAEAQAVVDKFNSQQEVAGRAVTVEFAKGFRRKRPPTTTSEASYKLYVSNLAWKVRGSHLKEFFSDVNPVTSRVVFENSPGGRSTGYGFVSFASKEEAEAAISAFDGKELMGRPIRLKISESKGADNSESRTQEAKNSEEANESESHRQETDNSEEANDSESQTQEADR
ncbi:31 kDa ribonucleoprotein, chloroplastic [Linum grandiflorum]